MKRSFWRNVLIIMSIIIATAGITNADNQHHQHYQQLVKKYFHDYLNGHPSSATYLGIHDYDGKLEDFSSDAHATNRSKLKSYLHDFQAIKSATLSANDRNDLELVINNLKSQLLEEEQIQMWRRDPDYYSSAITSSIFALIKRNFAAPEIRMHSVIERERQIPGALTTARTLLANPPKIYTETALQQLPGIIDFFQNTVPAAFTEVKDEKLKAEFGQANEAVISALKEYENFLQKDLLPRSQGVFAIGAENYRLKLSYEEMVDTPLDRLLEIGYQQLHKDQQALVATAKKIDANKSTLEVIAAMEKDHPSATALLPTAQQMLDGLRQFLIDKKIVSIPNGVQAKVVETPPFERATTFASMDTPGPFEEKASEAYYNITLPDPKWSAEKQEEYLEGYNNPLISNVSVHEVWPGHYLQFLSLKNNKKLSLVRKIMGSGSNAEGWAHYVEEMVLDEGYGNNDAKLRLAQLIDALLRDCRFIVGLQMHTKGMTYDQAVDFFVKEGYQKRVSGEIEARRGTSDPTYLIYTLGKLQILKLRHDYQEKMGKKFSLQEFHDRFIDSGSLPIKLIRRELLGHDGPLL